MDAGMDLLQGVQDAEAVGAPGGDLPPIPGDFQMPSIDKMMEIIQQMDMPEEEREQLKEALLNQGDFLSKMTNMGAGAMPAPVGGGFDPTTRFMIFFVAVLFIILVFVFFSYKLYKSLVDRERKREEKKKLKQQKKKK